MSDLKDDEQAPFAELSHSQASELCELRMIAHSLVKHASVPIDPLSRIVSRLETPADSYIDVYNSMTHSSDIPWPWF